MIENIVMIFWFCKECGRLSKEAILIQIDLCQLATNHKLRNSYE